MMIELTTPALLFPAISLLLLAYTNRFLALSALIRELNRSRQNEPVARDAAEREKIERQISNLRKRVQLIRSMQSLGIAGFLFCTLSMGAIFLRLPEAGAALFGASLFALALSLGQSFREIRISAGALDVLLEGLEKK